MRKPPLSAVLIVALSFAIVSQAFAAGPLGDKMKDPELKGTPGKTVKVTAGNSEEKGYEPWRHLQRFQIHLREVNSDNRLEAIGCETNEPLRSCDDLEAASRGNNPKGTRKIVSLTYQVYDRDWNSGVSDMFSKALARSNDERQSGVPSVEIGLSSTDTVFPEEACEQYSQPCYSRAICTVFNGCSKSKYSCVQCNP